MTNCPGLLLRRKVIRLDGDNAASISESDLGWSMLDVDVGGEKETVLDDELEFVTGRLTSIATIVGGT